MDENTPELAPESDADASTDAPLADDMPETAQDADEPESFDRDYVTKLRQEAAERRKAATDATKRADGYAQRLHAELVRADGRMADPADLPYDENHLSDPAALAAAVDSLLASKPHFASRRPAPGSTIHQGPVGAPVAPRPDLIAGLRAAMGSR